MIASESERDAHCACRKQRYQLTVTLCCTNQTFGILCFNLLRCVLALKWLLALASGHVMLRARGHFLGKITRCFETPLDPEKTVG